MLKKLAKYGNSTTLVIDKAILELLNMDESTVVKLQTDGVSLTLTPVREVSPDKKISYDLGEALVLAQQALTKGAAPKKLDKATMASLQRECAEAVTKNYEGLMKFGTEIFPSKEFQDAATELAERIDPVTHAEEYMKEFNNLTLRFCPELEGQLNELAEINKKYPR